MRKTISVSRGLSWAFAALLAVATTPATHAASENAARSKLAAALPAGVSLATASVNQTAGAVRASVANDPDMGQAILASAIAAKTPRSGKISCESLTKLTRAAITSDMKQASMLVEQASSANPNCSDSLNNLLVGGATDRATTTDVPTLFDAAEDFGFGVGFGPGFPGSPGFVGSPPSGSVSLPAASPTPITPATNG